MPFKIYSDEAASIYTFTEEQYMAHHYDKFPETTFFEPSQLQMIIPSYYSDSTWIASDSVRENIRKYACYAYNQNDAQIDPATVDFNTTLCEMYKEFGDADFPIEIGFQFKEKFDRPVSLSILTLILGSCGCSNCTWYTVAQLEEGIIGRQEATWRVRLNFA